MLVNAGRFQTETLPCADENILRTLAIRVMTVGLTGEADAYERQRSGRIRRELERRPTYAARVGADDAVNFLEILSAEEAARVPARACSLHLVD